MKIEELTAKQRDYFTTGATLPISVRLNALKRLREELLRQQGELCAALAQDLGKSRYESYMCEIGLVLSEIRHLLRVTPRLARPKRVATPLSQFAARSMQVPGPYGNVLILSPWNYPVLLTLDPLVDAIAAGNTAILKPSAYAPATALCLKRLITSCFPPEYVAVVTGGREENTALLSQKFDLVFFTGSQTVGKEVLARCAQQLTPAVLELGGKSPCIVDETAKLPLAAKRIVFGKYLNCGQTCVAPDYILCHSSVKAPLVQALKEEICRQFGPDPLKNPNYGRIISRRHFDRLSALLDPEKLVFGGERNPATLQISPAILDDISWTHPVMEEEIFGPILPILTYDRFTDLFSLLQDKPKPLALYLFSEKKERQQAVTTKLRYGGGCINDTMIHLATSELGFGGVGESGMGSYHGAQGFQTFSHTKSIVEKKTWLDLPMRYQPYRKNAENLLRFFLK